MMKDNVVNLAAYRKKKAAGNDPVVINNRIALRERWGVIRQKLEEKEDAKANNMDEE